LATGGSAINVGSLSGHAALRMAVMGMQERAPSRAELERMQKLLAEAMQAGAFGLSTGLVYPPGCFAGTDEIVALCRVVASYHGLYTSHIRGERDILDAVAGYRNQARRHPGCDLAQRPCSAPCSTPAPTWAWSSGLRRPGRHRR
jgi:N-acyl-D-aspartate/D-glutamate deacylase